MTERERGPWYSAGRPEGPNGAGRMWYYAQREPSLSSSCLSVGPFRTPQESEAEAERQNSLIVLRAAAPDLLAACEGLRAVIHDFLTHKEQTDCAVYIEAAVAALAKAEGGAA